MPAEGTLKIGKFRLRELEDARVAACFIRFIRRTFCAACHDLSPIIAEFQAEKIRKAMLSRCELENNVPFSGGGMVARILYLYN